MITITNGIKICDVPNGAYESIYKHQGWYPVKGESKEFTKPSVEEEETQKPVEDVVESNLLEKPIGEWTKDEVATFVKEHDIDTVGATKLNQVKKIVKEWIDENM